MKRYLFAAVQNVLLCALVLLMLVQAAYLLVLEHMYPHNVGMTSALRMLASDLSTQRVAGPQSVRNVSIRALWPSSVTLLSQEGDRIAYYTADRSADPVEMAVMLAADLYGSAQPSAREGAFGALLQSDALLIDLGRPLPASMALTLMGKTGGDATPVRRLLLAREGENLLLCADGLPDSVFVSSDMEQVVRYSLCAARLGTAGAARPIAVVGRGASAELPLGTQLPIEGRTSYRTMLAYNPLLLSSDDQMTVDYRTQSTVLSALNFSSGTLRRDVDADGGRVFVENNRSLRLRPDGAMTYRATEARFGVPVSDFLEGGERDSYTASEVILAGYALLDACLPPGLFGSLSAGLRYTGASYARRESRLTLYYEYVCAGLPVRLPDRATAAVLQYERGCFLAADIHLRAFDEVAAQPFYPGAVEPFLFLSDLDGVSALACEMVYDEAHGAEEPNGRLITPRYEVSAQAD